jgi:hypothetical protein
MQGERTVRLPIDKTRNSLNVAPETKSSHALVASFEFGTRLTHSLCPVIAACTSSRSTAWVSFTVIACSSERHASHDAVSCHSKEAAQERRVLASYLGVAPHRANSHARPVHEDRRRRLGRRIVATAGSHRAGPDRREVASSQDLVRLVHAFPFLLGAACAVIHGLVDIRQQRAS